MATNKVSIPSGMRDFGPDEMLKRNFIIEKIESVFKLHGFQEIATPSMEQLSVLTGKYGDEGDRLIYKVLNSGDYLKDAEIADQDYKKLTPMISEKALRYDLTVPLARYVVMHQNDISFPFKRYQIQPVWRADRPQKGRFREFYQCDIDIIGSNGLLNDLELIQVCAEIMSGLDLTDYQIQVNHRKILAGMAEVIGAKDRLTDLTIAIDKLDKIGKDGLEEELKKKEFNADQISKIMEYVDPGTSFDQIENMLKDSVTGLDGVLNIKRLMMYLDKLSDPKPIIIFSSSLARGLDYYTGMIIECSIAGSDLGSIAGGGRYDDLTSIFGLNDVSGTGISFGLERLYHIMEELNKFPDASTQGTQVLFANYNEASIAYCLPLVSKLRASGIFTELYPDGLKMAKQFKYADKRGIPWVIVAGEEEMSSSKLNLKNMKDGSQEQLSIDEIISRLSA